MIPNVKSVVFPTGNVARELVLEVSITNLLFQLNPSTPNYIGVFIGRLGFYSKKIPEQVPLRFDPQESLTKMNKYRKMDNRGIEMVDFQIISIKQATEEVRGRKSQSPFNKMIK